jgi:hypothetical protein
MHPDRRRSGTSLKPRLCEPERAGRGERILPTAIVEKFSRRRDGKLVPWTEGEPVAEVRAMLMPAPMAVGAVVD